MPQSRKPMVERTRRLSGSMLAFLLGAEDDTLREFAESAKSGHAAKTLIKQGPLRITLLALKRGTVLPSHQVAGPVSIQTVRGSLEVVGGKSKVEVPQGGLLALAPNVAHTAKALRDCSILITVVMPKALPEFSWRTRGPGRDFVREKEQLAVFVPKAKKTTGRE